MARIATSARRIATSAMRGVSRRRAAGSRCTLLTSRAAGQAGGARRPRRGRLKPRQGGVEVGGWCGGKATVCCAAISGRGVADEDRASADVCWYQRPLPPKRVGCARGWGRHARRAAPAQPDACDYELSTLKPRHVSAFLFCQNHVWCERRKSCSPAEFTAVLQNYYRFAPSLANHLYWRY